MNNDKDIKKDSTGQNNNNQQDQKNDEHQPLPLKTNLKTHDGKELTADDIENEQEFKEAVTERD